MLLTVLLVSGLLAVTLLLILLVFLLARTAIQFLSTSHKQQSQIINELRISNQNLLNQLRAPDVPTLQAMQATTVLSTVPVETISSQNSDYNKYPAYSDESEQYKAEQSDLKAAFGIPGVGEVISDDDNDFVTESGNAFVVLGPDISS